MTKELVIAANRHETKVALLEDDQLVEIFFQRKQEYSLAGSVHKGRVTRVLPGMQSAFVDLGLERDTFLYVSDFFEDSEEYEKLPAGDDRPERPAAQMREREPERGGDRSRGDRDRGDRNRGDRDRNRGGRGDRDRDRDRDRPPRSEELAAPQPAVAAAVAPAEEPVAPVVEVAVDGTITAPVLAEGAPKLEARTERNDRDRNRGDQDRNRGRRGRRRRGRGGREEQPRRDSRDRFPESKYADVKETPEAVEAGEAVEAPVEEFSVLPGESLAKYSRPADSDETDDFSDTDDSSEDLGDEGPDLETADEAIEAAPAEVVAAIVVVTPAEEVHHHHHELPITEAIAHVHAVEPEAIVSPAIEVTPIDPLVDEASGLTEDLLDQIQQQAEAFAQTHPSGAAPASAVAPLETDATVDVDEPATDIEADDDPDADGEIDSDSDIDGDGEALEEEEGRPEGVAPPTVEGGPTTQPPLASINSLSSSHREQTSRYMRGRRMRRRGNQQDAGVRTVEGQESQERRDRPERPDRPERGDRGPRGERGDRGGDRGDRGGDRGERPERPKERPVTPSITELLKEGQEIVVQIAKEPMGQKGARITSHIALPGRYCVYMPTIEHMGVSRKIASDEERQRLRRILQTHRQGIPGGFIIRTAGEGKTEDQIAQDLQYLYQLWLEIKQKSEKTRAPSLLYHDVEIVQRLLRDQLTENFKAIWVDNEELYETVVRFVQRMQPNMVSRVKLYTRSIPIFDAFNISNELEKALRPKVWLKSGGYIVINQTEALVAIDVNTGKFVGKSNRLEDTIVKTNTDAVKEIVRQIRLRDLGGIIVVDFIDMDERKNRQKVMQALEEAMRSDRAPNKILQFNDFGLVAITRKRVKQSLERTLCAPCAVCDGSGYTKSVQTIINEIILESQKLAPVVEGKEIMLRVHPTVAVALKSKDTDYLEELEETFGRPVLVSGDDSLHPEKFDLA